MSKKLSGSTWLRGAILSGLVLVVGGVGFKVLFSMRKPAKRIVHQVGADKVQTLKIKKQQLSLSLNGFGTTQSHKIVDLVPEVSGRAVYVSPLLKEGTRVKKGTLLLRIDSSAYAIEYRKLRGHVRSLKKQIGLLKQALVLERVSMGRNRRLLRRNVIDKGSYDQKRIRLIEREQRLEATKLALLSTQSLFQKASDQLRDTNIRAPFDGHISKTSLSKGAYIFAGRSIARLESCYVLEIPVSFPVSSLQSIRSSTGRLIDLVNLPRYLSTLGPVEVRQSSVPGIRWVGRVVRVGAKLDLATRTIPLWVQVSLRVKKPGKKVWTTQPTLLPGTFCKVKISIRKAKAVVVVPRSALYGEFAYLSINNRIHRRKVQILQRSGDSVILSKGLSVGDLLIVSPLVDPLVGSAVSSQDQAR